MTWPTECPPAPAPSATPPVNKPDKPIQNVCTWQKDADPSTSPHRHIERMERPKILPNVLYAIGNTPLVKLNKIPQSLGIKCDVLAKLEFFNPGGSVKDRIAYRMIEDAEASGVLKPGCTIIEPTSGNTGLGLAVSCAIKGYRCIIVIPEKMSNEKIDTLRALGAEIVKTPLTADSNSPEGPIGVAARLKSEIPDSVVLDQYTNPGNPLAHYDTTAKELQEQCDGKIDMLVAGAGTGGTITGLGRYFKTHIPDCKIVGVDPEGSILAEPPQLNTSDITFYEVEGIGYDFIPTVLDRAVVDEWIKVNDQMSFPMARRLIKEEGILCGGSSGAALAAALKACTSLNEGQKCVVILPDGLRNYMTKFLSDSWMEAREFAPSNDPGNHWWWNEKVSTLQVQPTPTITGTTTCEQALNIMKKEDKEYLPVTDKNGKVDGVVSSKSLMNMLIGGKVTSEEPVNKTVNQKFIRVKPDTNIGKVFRILEKEDYVLVVDKTKADCSPKCGKETVLGFLTISDLHEYTSKKDAVASRSVTSSSSNDSSSVDDGEYMTYTYTKTVKTTTITK